MSPVGRTREVWAVATIASSARLQTVLPLILSYSPRTDFDPLCSAPTTSWAAETAWFRACQKTDSSRAEARSVKKHLAARVN
jgi:hypothetical protein